VFAFVSVALLSSGAAFAQVGDAEVAGAVTDPSGAPVAGAKVSLTNDDTGVSRAVVADNDGRYLFPALAPGRYSLKAEAPGFRTESVTGIVLNVGSHIERGVPLTVGNVQEAITVTADSPPIDTSKGDVSGVVTQHQIDSLPVNTRQYLNLALLMPGTTQDASRTFYNNVQIGGGGRFYANGFEVDGVTNTWAEQGEPRQNFPEGAVQEFRVNTNQFKAEQGLAMGGVVNVVTKSGTNGFHGEGFEYFRDSALNHDNKFVEQALQSAGQTGKAPFERNQFGGDIGGPIIKNRTHFYAAYERTETDDSFLIFAAASHQFYSANEGVKDKPSHDQMLNLRVDHQFSNSQHAFARYSQEWNKQTWQGCGGTVESNCYDGLIPRHSVVAGDTWTAKPNLVNEFRFQYALASYLLGPSGQPIFTTLGQYPPERLAQLQTVYVFPSFRYGQGYGELGTEKRWEFKDDVSYIRGRHNLKFGFDYSHIPFADDTVINYQGTWTFATDQAFNPNDPTTIANLKNPTQFSAAIPGQYTSVPVSQYSAYVQDDWRVTDRFTLNLGLRWDREVGSYNEDVNPASFPVAIPYIGNPKDRGQAHNFGPRFGFAWDLLGNGKNVVRGGFGIYYNNIQTLLNFPENRNISQCNVLITNPSYPDPYGGKSPTAFCSAAPPTVTVLDKNFSMPYSEQFTLGYSREIVRDFSVHLDGVYMHTLKDWATVDMNYPDATGARPLPAYARVLDHKPISQYKYRALYVRAEKRFARRYQFLVSYTLANNKDNNPQAQVTNQNNYGLDWGFAGIDRRNSLVASGSANLPWKFNLGIIWQLRSSLPFSAFSTTVVDGVTQYIPGLSRNLGNRNNAAVIAAVNAYRASLATPLAPFTTSQIDSSKFNSFDVVISRPIYVRESFRIEARGQAFNLFGTTNLTGGTTTSGSSANFGKILNASNLQQAELAARIIF
jgi:outer membrane receptor protein involved in Fe transport